MNTTNLEENRNTVLILFSGRCGLNPCHRATVVHHIIPKSVCEGDPHGIENLIPLCNECHDKIHQEGTKKYRKILMEKRKESEWID